MLYGSLYVSKVGSPQLAVQRRAPVGTIRSPTLLMPRRGSVVTVDSHMLSGPRCVGQEGPLLCVAPPDARASAALSLRRWVHLSRTKQGLYSAVHLW